MARRSAGILLRRLVMVLPKILVTGATGKTGGAVVAELVQRGWPVRALVRSRDARSAALDSMGVETFVADLFDSEQLLDAMRGIQRVYFLPLFDRFMIQSAAAFAVAAREAKLEQIVQLGQWLSNGNHPSLLTRQTWLADQLFSMIPGTAHTIVNPGMFADNFLRVIDFAALLGIYPVLSSEGRAAPVSNEDIARVSAAVLTGDPRRHDGKSYRPTGPKLLSGREMAAIVAQVVGHRVLPVDLPWFLFLKVARMQGVDPFELSSYRRYMEEMSRGTFALDGGVNDVVRELAGGPAEDFETTARRYAAMPFARQTLANRLRALASFSMAPFYPGYNLDRWERQIGLPVAPTPSLSIDDERWRTEHAAPGAPSVAAAIAA
jgi:uncharacterized protein YbjT (DUF2867 family)